MTQILQTADLTWMRGIQERIQPGTAIVYRSTQTTDGMGGFDEAWAAVGTVSARLLPPSGVEKIAGEQPSSITRWYITLPQSTDVTAKDRISYNSARMFEVDVVNNDESWHTALRCDVTAIGEEAFREVQVPVGTTDYSLNFSLAKNSHYLGAM